MSVLGVGIDLVDITSFSEQLAIPGSTLLGQVFTPVELADADSAGERTSSDSSGRNRRLAGRFAAKEAFVKAWSSARLGQTPSLNEVRFRELEILNDPWGRPFLRSSGGTRAAVARTIGTVDVQVSITHDGPMAAAVVILSRAEAP